MKVCIEDVADELEMCMDGWEQFLNTETGEIAALADGMWVDRDEELEEEIENSDCYVRLPNQYEIHYRTKEGGMTLHGIHSNWNMRSGRCCYLHNSIHEKENGSFEPDC